VFAAVTAGASHHLPNEADPVIPETAFEVHTHGRVFGSVGEITGMFEYNGRFEGPQREFRYLGFTAGGYYRVQKNLKLGLFYRLQMGARHDDDWIEEGTAWLWADTRDRPESVVIIDATPRFLLDFLPGEDWVLSVKSRYEYNFYNGQQSLLVRPGLTWFWIEDREPILNVSAQYAAYLSLNFGSSPWYRLGPYLNLLYHVTPALQLDASVSRQRVYWSESASFIADFGTTPYEENIYTPWLVDVGLIVNLR
jgi:hypothetical protein